MAEEPDFLHYLQAGHPTLLPFYTLGQRTL